MTIYGYRNVTLGDVDAIARSWLKGPSRLLTRHIDAALAERKYAWDPDLDDDANRASFNEICDRVLRRAQHLQEQTATGHDTNEVQP